MMRTNSPESHGKQNEQFKSARRDQVVTPVPFSQAEDTAARDLTYVGVPTELDDAAETEPAVVMPSADEFSAFPAEGSAESADAQAHPDVDDSLFDAAGDDWAGEEPD